MAAPLLRLERWLARWQWPLVVAALVIGAVDQGLNNSAVGVDFRVFYRAALRLARGDDLYVLADGHFSYKYLPAAGVPFLPLTWLSPRVAFTLWDVLSSLAIARLMWFSARALDPAPRFLTHVAVLLLAMPFFTRLWFLGQCDAILLWLVVESERAAARRPALSGALLALACAFKPPFGLVLVAALLRRQHRRLAAAALAGLAVLALPALWYGWAGNLALLHGWRALLATTTPPLLCDEQNFSAWAVACFYLATPADGVRYQLAVAAVAGLCTGLVAIAAWRIHRRDAALGWFAALGGVLWLVAFLSPLGWRTNLIATVPLQYLAVELVWRGERRAVRVAAAAALLAMLLVGDLQPAFSRVALRWLTEHRDLALAGAALAAAALLGTAHDLRSRRLPDAAAPTATLGEG